MRFWEVYLVTFVFWTQLTTGALALLALHGLTGGKWGDAIAPTLKAMTRAFAPLAFCLVPIFFGARQLYPWMLDPQLQAKGYLSFTPFVVKSLAYFALWFLLSVKIRRLPPPDKAVSADRYYCAWVLVLVAISTTFASIDWIMSREPHWHSTIFGLIFMSNALVGAMAFAIARSSKAQWKNRSAFHDLGNILMALILCWAYVDFMQFLIIWSANLPDEVSWYLIRSGSAWWPFPWILAGLSLFGPFIALIFIKFKRNLVYMRILTWLVLGCRALELFWQIAPPTRPFAAFSPFDLLFIPLIFAPLAVINARRFVEVEA